MTGNLAWAIVGVVLLVATAALLALAETALTHLGTARADALEDEGVRGAARLRRLLERRDRALNPILLVRVACFLGIATIVAAVVSHRAGAVGVVVALAVEVLVVFVLAEATPKTYALLRTDQSALRVAPFARALAAFWPLRWVTRALVGLTNLLLPGRRAEGPAVTEEELLALAGAAADAAVIETEERALITSVIRFGDTIAREVMVPRTDMVAVAADFEVGAAMEVVLLNGYSRIPVYGDGGIDDVTGVLYAKDLMRAERDGNDAARVGPLARTAHFVPETKRVAELLREMQAETFHMAIVIDEYGGTAGLATLEDLIEELVGEIVDEFDVEDPMIEPLPGGVLRVNGRLAIDEANDVLGEELPEGDWDTVAGLLFSLLGHVAVEGDTAETDEYVLRADKVQGRRISRVRITPRPRPPVDHDGTDGDDDRRRDRDRDREEASSARRRNGRRDEP